MAVVAVVWVGIWVILVKLSLDRGIQAASALCKVPQVSDCNVLVAVDWKLVYLPLAGLVLILVARWLASDRRGGHSSGRLTPLRSARSRGVS